MVSEPDHGISDAMNKGIRMATGDVIGIIHSDDMLHENALRRIEAVYDESIDVYYGDCLVCDESGKKMHILTAKSDLSGMPYSFGMIHPSTFITRKAYEKWGLYSTSPKYAMDYELLLRFYKKQAVMKYMLLWQCIALAGRIRSTGRRRSWRSEIFPFTMVQIQ